MDTETEIWFAILHERQKQDRKWGGPEHDDTHVPVHWNRIIQHYSELAIGAIFVDENPADYRRHLIQVAALAVAAIQSHDRKQQE